MGAATLYPEPPLEVPVASEFSVDELKLAFAYHVVQLIVGADQVVSQAEAVYVTCHFPAEILRSSGYVDDDGLLTPRFSAARDAALADLPDLLDMAAKRALVSMFVGAAVVDDQLDHGESQIFVAAASLLGLSTDELDAHLDTLDDSVGSFDLPDPEA